MGVDFSERMVANARLRHPATDLRQADTEALPLGDAQFDGVAINFGFLHFTRPRQALAEARRVLRDGGRIAFTVWASPQENRLQGEVFDAMAAIGGKRPALPPPPGGLVQTPESCRRLLEDADFEDIATRPCRRMVGFRDGEELLRVLEEGTVQTSAKLTSLDSRQQQALSRSLDSRLEATAMGLRVESAAWLATASKLMP